MNDDRLERALSDAITDLAGTSAPDYLDDIFERTSRTRQRPWWTFPRRYFAMAPTLKFATAAGLAFVLGIGLAPLIMPADDGGGGAPGAASPSASPEASERIPPIEFTSRWMFGPDVGEVEEVVVPGVGVTYINAGWQPGVLRTGDSRFGGRVTLMASGTEYEEGTTLQIWNTAFRVVNDDGAWQQRPGVNVVIFDAEPNPAPYTAVFDGEGAYEGLVAVTAITRDTGGWDVRGVILGDHLEGPPALTPTE